MAKKRQSESKSPSGKKRRKQKIIDLESKPSDGTRSNEAKKSDFKGVKNKEKDNKIIPKAESLEPINQRAFTPFQCKTEEPETVRRAESVMHNWCGNCGSLNHSVYQCIRIDHDGLTHGCPLCNTISHAIDECDKFNRLSIDGKFTHLVTNRINMPGFYMQHGRWWHFADGYFRKNPHAFQAGLPWSDHYAKRIVQPTGAFMRAYEKYVDSRLLAADPAMLTPDSFRDTCHIKKPREYGHIRQ